MMLGVHVQDKRRILFLQAISKDVLGCMGPLHFKPLCLAIECANLVLLFRLEASFVDLLYIPLGTSSRQTQSTCSSNAIPQYSVDESQHDRYKEVNGGYEMERRLTTISTKKCG
nr:hypothetical protein [Tanacetum cinerariifolium]